MKRSSIKIGLLFDQNIEPEYLTELEDAFPGADFQRGEMTGQLGPFIYQTVVVKSPQTGETLFILDGGSNNPHAATVYTRSPHVVGPSGERAGKSRFGDIEWAYPVDCFVVFPQPDQYESRQEIECWRVTDMETKGSYRNPLVHRFLIPSSLSLAYPNKVPREKWNDALLIEMHVWLDRR